MSSNRRRKKERGKEDDFDLIKKVIDSNLVSRKEDDRMSKRKKIEAKLDELHVTGSLCRLIGAIPYTSNGDNDWKKEKEAYLMEKYGK